MGDITLKEGPNVLNVQLVPIPPPTADLSGTVTDSKTGSPIYNVLITISGIAVTASTDIKGYYSFKGLSPGSYIVTFKKAGYETATR